MNFLSPKSLAFYAGSIVAVVALFTIATSYGETHLQAPRKIEGRYPLPATLPGCLQSKQLVLSVQQSGIYLTAALIPTDATENAARIAEDRPALTGRWTNEQLTLTGAIAHLPTCQGTATIQGSVTNDILNGTLQLSTVPGETAISAQRETPKNTDKER